MILRSSTGTPKMKPPGNPLGQLIISASLILTTSLLGPCSCSVAPRAGAVVRSDLANDVPTQLWEDSARFATTPPWTPYDEDRNKSFARCLKAKSGERPEFAEFCYAWRYMYSDEHDDWQGFDVRLVEDSLDERVANVHHLTVAARPLNLDLLTIKTGDANEDERLLRAIAGPQVNDELCGHQLGQMVTMLDHFEARLEAKRQNVSYELKLTEEDIRLGRVLESFGRYESGMMSGRTHAPGSYHQCISNRMLLPATGSQRANQVGARPSGRGEGQIKVKARYCWARLDMDKHRNGQLKGRPPSELEVEQKVFHLGTCLPESCHSKSFAATTERGRANLRLAKRLIDSQFKLPQSLYIEQTLEVLAINCMIDQEGQYGVPPAGKLVLSLLACWLLLVVYATLCHTTKAAAMSKKTDDTPSAGQNGQLVGRAGANNTSWTQAILECANLKSSWQDFIEERQESGPQEVLPKDRQRGEAAHEQPPPRRVDLNVLNPIKAFGACFVVYGHSLEVHVFESQNAMRALNLAENHPLELVMIVGSVIVDTFFVITGILMGYLTMRHSSRSKRDAQHERGSGDEKINGITLDRSAHTNKTELIDNNNKREWFKVKSVGDKSVGQAATPPRAHNRIEHFFRQWFGFIVHRYLRLMPLFLIVHAMKRSVLLYWIGSDLPLWDHGLDLRTMNGACKHETWLMPIIMMTGYEPILQQCLGQTWTFTTDLLVSIAIMPLVLIMTRRPYLASIIGLVLAVRSYLWQVEAFYGIPLHMMVEVGHTRAHGVGFVFGVLHTIYTHPQVKLISLMVGVAAGYTLHKYHESERRQTFWPKWFRGPLLLLSVGHISVLVAGAMFLPQLRPILAPHQPHVLINQFTKGRILWAISNAIIFMRMATDWKDGYLMKQFSGRFWAKFAKLNLAILLIHKEFIVYHMGAATSTRYYTHYNIYSMFSASYMACIPTAIVLHVLFENPINKIIKRFVRF